jgi:hypothetical protein
MPRISARQQAKQLFFNDLSALALQRLSALPTVTASLAGEIE